MVSENNHIRNVREGRKKKKSLIMSQPLQSSNMQAVKVIRMDLVKDLESKGST